MFKQVKIQLNEKNHAYQYLDTNDNQYKTASKIISGSSFFKPWVDNSNFKSSSKLYGMTAINLGTSIHKIMEELLTYYKLHRDIDILYKIALKYKEDNFMLYNIINNTANILSKYQIIDIDLEITKGMYDDVSDILICGTADVILTAKENDLIATICIDFKTMLTAENSNYDFITIFENTLDDLIYKDISYDYYLTENDLGYNDFLKLQKKALNYIYQFGLYAVLNYASEIVMITSLENKYCIIDTNKTIELRRLVREKITKDYYAPVINKIIKAYDDKHTR